MKEVFHRIEAWLAQEAPEVLESLNPPASDESIAKAEAALGVELPSDMKALYRIHDGEEAHGFGLLDGWEWLSLSRVVDEWTVWKDLLDGGDFEGTENDEDGELVRRDWWHPAWIPISYSGGGDHHCLDLAPGPKGERGQIIEMWHDAGERPRVATSLRAWFTTFANDLEAGRYEVDDGTLLKRD